MLYLATLADTSGFVPPVSAVFGDSGTGPGLVGSSASNVGVMGRSDTDIGVLGQALGTGGRGVVGVSRSATGTEGNSDTGDAVFGRSRTGRGVVGVSDSATGVEGNSNTGIGVFGRGGAFAGVFEGNVRVTGRLVKNGGGFRIDHPLDPASKHLWHSFVESPDMKNIYDGVTTLDERGEAVVELPDWFEALNRDFRYQLTAIGGAAPNLHIAEEVAGNRFRIAGGHPGMKVSWTLTGIRQDAWANAYRIPVESAKGDKDRRPEIADAQIGAL